MSPPPAGLELPLNLALSATLPSLPPSSRLPDVGASVPPLAAVLLFLRPSLARFFLSFWVTIEMSRKPLNGLVLLLFVICGNWNALLAFLGEVYKVEKLWLAATAGEGCRPATLSSKNDPRFVGLFLPTPMACESSSPPSVDWLCSSFLSMKFCARTLKLTSYFWAVFNVLMVLEVWGPGWSCMPPPCPGRPPGPGREGGARDPTAPLDPKGTSMLGSSPSTTPLLALLCVG